MLSLLGEAVAETLYPTRCIGCDCPGVLLCPECSAALERIDLLSACPRCGAPYGSLVCTECLPPSSARLRKRVQPDAPSLPLPSFAFDGARCACSYTGIAKELVRAYKDGDEQRLAAIMAHELLRATKGQLAGFLAPEDASCGGKSQALEDWTCSARAIIPVPPTPSHVRERGWEHLGPIAHELSVMSGLPVVEALLSAKAADQRKLTRQERIANRIGSFAVKEPCLPLPETIILLDDVLTTGATCSAAADALKNAGARRVLVLTFARVW